MQSEDACRFRHVSQRGLGGRRIGRIDQHGNTNRLGHQVVQQTQSLGHNFGGQKIDAGRIAARPGKAGDQTHLDRVFGDAEDDRDRRGRGFSRRGSGGEGGHGNHSNATADEVGHERRQAIVLALQPVVLDRHVLALDVAGFVEGFAERRAKARGFVGRSGADKADDRHCRLLRTRRERPSRRAAEQC